MRICIEVLLGAATQVADISLKLRHPYTPILNSKNGVYRGIHYFLIFAQKHISWVVVRNASVRWF